MLTSFRRFQVKVYVTFHQFFTTKCTITTKVVYLLSAHDLLMV